MKKMWNPAKELDEISVNNAPGILYEEITTGAHLLLQLLSLDAYATCRGGRTQWKGTAY